MGTKPGGIGAGTTTGRPAAPGHAHPCAPPVLPDDPFAQDYAARMQNPSSSSWGKHGPGLPGETTQPSTQHSGAAHASMGSAGFRSPGTPAPATGGSVKGVHGAQPSQYGQGPGGGGSSPQHQPSDWEFILNPALDRLLSQHPDSLTCSMPPHHSFQLIITAGIGRATMGRQWDAAASTLVQHRLEDAVFSKATDPSMAFWETGGQPGTDRRCVRFAYDNSGQGLHKLQFWETTPELRVTIEGMAEPIPVRITRRLEHPVAAVKVVLHLLGSVWRYSVQGITAAVLGAAGYTVVGSTGAMHGGQSADGSVQVVGERLGSQPRGTPPAVLERFPGNKRVVEAFVVPPAGDRTLRHLPRCWCSADGHLAGLVDVLVSGAPAAQGPPTASVPAPPPAAATVHARASTGGRPDSAPGLNVDPELPSPSPHHVNVAGVSGAATAPAAPGDTTAQGGVEPSPAGSPSASVVGEGSAGAQGHGIVQEDAQPSAVNQPAVGAHASAAVATDTLDTDVQPPVSGVPAACAQGPLTFGAAVGSHSSQTTNPLLPRPVRRGRSPGAHRPSPRYDSPSPGARGRSLAAKMRETAQTGRRRGMLMRARARHQATQVMQRDSDLQQDSDMQQESDGLPQTDQVPMDGVDTSPGQTCRGTRRTRADHEDATADPQITAILDRPLAANVRARFRAFGSEGEGVPHWWSDAEVDAASLRVRSQHHRQWDTWDQGASEDGITVPPNLLAHIEHDLLAQAAHRRRPLRKFSDSSKAVKWHDAPCTHPSARAPHPQSTAVAAATPAAACAAVADAAAPSTAAASSAAAASVHVATKPTPVSRCHAGRGAAGGS